jgi:hypothetical protein
MRVIQEPSVQRLLNAFERVEEGDDQSYGEVTGRLDLARAGELENVVAINGSSVAVPNALRSYRQVTFVTFGAVCLSRTQMNTMKANPIVDPWELAARLQERIYHGATVLPLCPGSRVPILRHGAGRVATSGPRGDAAGTSYEPIALHNHRAGADAPHTGRVLPSPRRSGDRPCVALARLSGRSGEHLACCPAALSPATFSMTARDETTMRDASWLGAHLSSWGPMPVMWWRGERTGRR